MSPTSYQAAPPRENILSESQWRVKPTGSPQKTASTEKLPGTIGCVLKGRDGARSRVHIGHSAASLVGTQHKVVEVRVPFWRAGDRIYRDLTQVARRNQVVEGLRRLLLIESVLLD